MRGYIRFALAQCPTSLGNYNPELQCCVASYIQLIVICCGEQNSRFLCDKNAGKIKVKALKIFSNC